MIVKDANAGRRQIGLLVLLGAALIGGICGALLRGGGKESQVPEPAAEPAGPFAHTPAAVAPILSLETLHLRIAASDAAQLQAARGEALARGQLLHDEEVVVPASCRLGKESIDARVRLKGDLTDHLDTDRWSLRIEAQGSGKLAGMSSFSIQHPKTRGWLMEWLIMAIARRDGLLAPRSTFVNVVINDRPSGVYYLEEHFSKELLEAQGRREGPIVRFKEETLWSTYFQYGASDPPPEAVLAWSQHAAEIGAYDEKHLASTTSLNRRLQRALEHMRVLQRKMIENRSLLPESVSGSVQGLRLDAMQELQARTIDEIFVADRLGRALALYSLFQAYHGLAWHQLRFYHDPVLDRLEMIVFDTGANPVDPRQELVLEHPAVRELMDSEAVRRAAYSALGKMTAPAWLDGVVAALGPQLEGYAAALIADGTLPAGFPANGIFEQLRKNCDRVRSVIQPLDPANFSARLVSTETGNGGPPLDMIEVEAWATTFVPVVVERFTFSNGRSVAAARTTDEARHRDGTAVVLPRQGRRLVMRFPADARLSALHDVDSIKAAIRARTERDGSVKLEVDAEFRPLAATSVQRERLNLRRAEPAPDGDGRPRPPSLLEALDKHACLGFDLEQDRLYLRPGTWDVAGDLLLPAGQALHAGGGTRLRFAPNAVMLASGALQVRGTAQEPVVFEAQDRAAGWAGLVVLDAAERSRCEHLIVRDANCVVRGGWQTLGGVTFYRSALDLIDSRIEHALGEDAINVFGADVLFERLTIDGGASDLFDGDFVTGTVRDCTFAASGEDAIDVSGSRLEVERCRFDRIGDKCVSVGEQSQLQMRLCTATTTSIGAASKDRSTLEIDGFEVDRAENYGLAAYVKKPEYGASRIVARGLRVREAGRSLWIAQEGCTIEVDGKPIPTQPIDVDDLYRRKILGK
jgi:hypothetical protein